MLTRFAYSNVRHISLPILAIRPMGGRRGRRPTADHQRTADAYALQGQERVLERSSREGIRQV